MLCETFTIRSVLSLRVKTCSMQFGLCCAMGSVASAQNFVPNGDFEQYSLCPTSNSQIDRALPWFNAFVGMPWGPGPTPDYLNACTTLAGIDIPSNNYGVQFAHSGSAYGGFAVYLQYSPDFREYMEVQLTQPLVAGSCYELSFHLTLAETFGNTASGDIGACFTGALLAQTSWDTLPVVPQLDHLGGLVTDTINWVLVSAIYQAQGGEEYLTIGNFHDDATTAILPVDTPFAIGVAMASYYFIDDVSLVLIESPIGGTCAPLAIDEPEAGTPSWQMDPFGDRLTIASGLSGQVALTIWDMSGKVVLARVVDQRTAVAVGHLVDGLYAVQLVDRVGTATRGTFIKH
ncbi:MAG: T9SS type A sorting domain-containing protein [Flavobacteriales bacterium]